MMFVMIFISFFVIGFILGLVKLIVGDTIFYILCGLFGLYVLYSIINFFGAFWGITLVVGFILLVIIGLITYAVDVGSSIISFFKD